MVNGTYSRRSSTRTLSELSLSHRASSSSLAESRAAAVSSRRTSSDAPIDGRDLPFAVGFTAAPDPLNGHNALDRDVPKTHDVSLVLRAPVISQVGSSRSIKGGSGKARDGTSRAGETARGAQVPPPPAPPLPAFSASRSPGSTGDGQRTIGDSARPNRASTRKKSEPLDFGSEIRQVAKRRAVACDEAGILKSGPSADPSADLGMALRRQVEARRSGWDPGEDEDAAASGAESTPVREEEWG